MMRSFTLDLPRGVEFGPGARRRLPDLAARYGRRLLLLSGAGHLERSGRLAELTGLLQDFDLQHLACPPGEPTSEGIQELLGQARPFGAEVLVAAGGGSVLDTAKALSGLLPAGGRVDDYLEGVGEGLEIPGAGIPWIGLPTTAGTGAEVTKNAVLRSLATGLKRSLRSPFLLAAHAIVDPELTLDAPRRITGVAGMDALTQLVESYLSRKAAPVPQALARQAFPVMLESLRRLAADPQDPEARSGAAYGATISGLALANSGLGAAHGFASGLGGMAEVPHGLICAVLIRPVLRANAGLIAAGCEELRRTTLERSGGGDREAKRDPVEWLESRFAELFRLYELPENLAEYGIDRALIPEIARRSSGSSMSGNPRELDLEERERLLSSVI